MYLDLLLTNKKNKIDSLKSSLFRNLIELDYEIIEDEIYYYNCEQEEINKNYKKGFAPQLRKILNYNAEDESIKLNDQSIKHRTSMDVSIQAKQKIEPKTESSYIKFRNNIDEIFIHMSNQHRRNSKDYLNEVNHSIIQFYNQTKIHKPY